MVATPSGAAIGVGCCCAAAAYILLRRLTRRRLDNLDVRRDLVAAHHLSHAFKFDELVWNHISARVPGTDRFLITSGTENFDEVTPASLVESSSANANITADVIHGAIYRARPDVNAIVHHHTPHAMAVSMLPEGLRFLTQDSSPFVGKVAYHDWEGLSDDYDERSRIAAALGPSAHTLIMRNHGACTVGASVGEAWVRYYYLEICCRTQLSISHLAKIIEPAAAVLAHAASQYARRTARHMP